MCWKSILLTTVGIVFGTASVLCGDAIQGSTSTAQMFGITTLSLVFLGIGALLVGLAGVVDDYERDKSDKRVKRKATHQNWRGDFL